MADNPKLEPEVIVPDGALPDYLKIQHQQRQVV